MRVVESARARRGTEVVVAVAFGTLAAVSEPELAMVAVVGVAAVAVGSWSQGTRTGLLGLAVLVVASVVRAVAVDGHGLHLTGELPPALLRAGVPWLAAVALRQYVSLGRRADRERELRRRQRVAELRRRTSAERLAVAQALHDDLGHSLSLVALNLGRLELDTTLPDPARTAVSRAREDLARAVERLGDSVVGLRSGTPFSRPPAEPIDALIARARVAGARIEATELPEKGRLEAFDHVLVARVLREALTNASTHAPGGSVDIDVVDSGSQLRIRVVNGAGDGRVGPRTAGTGLRALERDLHAAGGSLEAVPSAGGFVLAATVPALAHAPDRSADALDDTDVVDDEDPVSRTSSRAQRRTLTAAVAVIVIGLAAGEAAVIHEKSGALLPADDFAMIGVGDAREDVAALLPRHDLPLDRGEARPSGCQHYAVTANSFHDAARDVYRICFVGDVVVSATHIRGEDR